MATPVILFDSSGSDTAASGAGPGTALSGTSASYSGSVFTLDGSPDLSGVATDGSHVIWVSTSTGRKFFTINATDDGADTVTVDDAPAGTTTGLTWGLGGKRATLAGSLEVIENGGGDGDCKDDWIIEFGDGYTETITGEVNARGPNSTIYFQGESGATTLPVLSFSGNTDGIISRAESWVFQDFEIRSTGTKTSTARAIVSTTTARKCKFQRLNVTHTSTFEWQGTRFDGDLSVVSNCVIASGDTIGIDSKGQGNRLLGNYIHDISGSGISTSGIQTGTAIDWNIVADVGGDGIRFENTRTDEYGAGHSISFNTVDGSAGDGIEILPFDDGIAGMRIENNQITNNGGYGLNFSDGSATAAGIDNKNVLIRSNRFFTNTSGKYNPTGLANTNEQTDDPSYGDAASGDYTPPATHKGQGSPKTVGGVISEVYIGAIQREEAAAGGAIVNQGLQAIESGITA